MRDVRYRIVRHGDRGIYLGSAPRAKTDQTPDVSEDDLECERRRLRYLTCMAGVAVMLAGMAVRAWATALGA
jgi:hypothetical protein